MRVFLTIDVESYTGDYELEVHGHGLGLNYIVEQCKAHGVVGTFFVEALGATRWGREPLAKICRLLNEAGQDIQLHLHPVVADIEGFKDDTDVLHFQDKSSQTRLLSVGLSELREAGARHVSAFRAGDFAANADTLEAMREVGLSISSNRDLDTKCSIRSQLNETFSVVNDIAALDGLPDVPVSVLRSPFPKLDGRYRHMEISAMGLDEMCSGLARMAASGYRSACILTHPGEFFFRDGSKRPIMKNRARLEGLLRFVDKRSDMGFGVLGRDAAQVCPLDQSPPIPLANPVWAMARVAEQVWFRVAGRF